MFDPIPDPISGKSILPWAVPVTRALNALGDKVGATARNERDRRPTQQPQPFEVRWDGSLNNSSGGWKIYLPTEHLLSYGDIDVATSDISGATAIQDDDNNDTSWFSLDDVDTSADHVWLVVTVTESNGSVVSVEAEFAAEEGQEETDEKIHNVCVAEVSYTEPEEDGGTAIVEIKQSVVGALHLGGKSDSVTPDDVSTEFIPEPEEGEEPTGDEGKLQIKGFKSGQPADTNTIAEYLMGTAQISGQVWLIVRGKSTGGDPVLSYLPLDALNLYDYAKKNDLPTVNDGTLTIKQGTTTLGTFTANQATGTTVTIPTPPTPPTVNDGTLTIKQGTTTLGTFTANQATGTTVTIPEPPTPPTVNNGVLTLNLGSLSKTFSANQATNETVTVPAKTIAAGSNIAIAVNGNTITISSSGGVGATSGFSGTRRTVAETRYSISARQLQAKYFTETWSNGLMTASTVDSAWSVIPGGQAVTETV